MLCYTRSVYSRPALNGLGVVFEMRDAVATAQALRFVARAVTEWEEIACCVLCVSREICCARGESGLSRPDPLRDSKSHYVVV